MKESFQFISSWSRVSKDAITKAKATVVANISDAMNYNNIAPAALSAMHRSGLLCGPALTVRCQPDDKIMLHIALMMAEPGDVIVVDADGSMDNAIMSEDILTRAAIYGVAGFVIYGAIKDSEVIANQDTPVFAMGVSHRGPYKDGTGGIGLTITLGSMLIEPGDLIVGDQEGVICVPKDSAEKVLGRAEENHYKEVIQNKRQFGA